MTTTKTETPSSGNSRGSDQNAIATKGTSATMVNEFVSNTTAAHPEGPRRSAILQVNNARLAGRLRDRGYTDTQSMAAAMGLPEGTLLRTLSGELVPSAYFVAMACALTGFSIAALFAIVPAPAGVLP